MTSDEILEIIQDELEKSGAIKPKGLLCSPVKLTSKTEGEELWLVYEEVLSNGAKGYAIFYDEQEEIFAFGEYDEEDGYELDGYRDDFLSTLYGL